MSERVNGTAVVVTGLGCVVALFVAKAVLSPIEMRRALVAYLLLGVCAVVGVAISGLRKGQRPELSRRQLKAAVLLALFWPAMLIFFATKQAVSGDHARNANTHTDERDG